MRSADAAKAQSSCLYLLQSRYLLLNEWGKATQYGPSATVVNDDFPADRRGIAQTNARMMMFVVWGWTVPLALIFALALVPGDAGESGREPMWPISTRIGPRGGRCVPTVLSLAPPIGSLNRGRQE